jgi:hypothetical protein
MGLGETIQAAVSSAFSAIDDLLVAAVYLERISENYSAETGVPTISSKTHRIRVVRAKFSVYEITAYAVHPTDLKILINANGLGFTPKPADTVTIATSVYDVVSASQDPAGALWTLHLRHA